MHTINPSTGAVLAHYTYLTTDEIKERIQKAKACFETWRHADFGVRSKYLHAVAKQLRARQDEYAHLMATEMGKPLAQGCAEIEKCAWACEHAAKQAKTYLAPQIIQTESHKSFVSYQPLGVVLGIMPWNFPFWQVFRFAASTLMAGNTVVMKHALITTGSGEMIADLFLQAGCPSGLFQHLILDHEGTSRVITHEDLVGVSLTGSERAGADIASQAGQHLKKTVLELGGNDPYIILPDADLMLAAEAVVSSRLNNAGQVCIAAKRIIVVQSIADAFLAKLSPLVDQYIMGDPLDLKTTLGPLARDDLRTNLDRQIQASVAKGAILLKGGVIPEGPGYFYPPTILTHVTPGMPAFDEELFGPVIAIVIAKDEEEAIRLANLSHYGLSAAVFTNDLKRGEQIALEALEAGLCCVNGVGTSDPRLPFGGIKRSGFGRELSEEGMKAFVNTKTVVIHAP